MDGDDLGTSLSAVLADACTAEAMVNNDDIVAMSLQMFSDIIVDRTDDTSVHVEKLAYVRPLVLNEMNGYALWNIRCCRTAEARTDNGTVVECRKAVEKSLRRIASAIVVAEPVVGYEK
jgi:hypothetical protein